MHSPLEYHVEVVQKILRYLKFTLGKGLLFLNNNHSHIETYTNANWGRSIADYKLTSGYYTFVEGNLVNRKSKKQPVVGRSSAEAECHAMAQGICELLWLKILLKELKMESIELTIQYMR